MEIRQLRYLLAALRHGNLQEAAREHFVTQPAISAQLKKLEHELGAKLYARSGRRIIATPVGRTVAPLAEEVLQRIDALRAAVQGLKGLTHGELRLGNIDAASVYVLPSIFRAFRKKYPGIDIRVVVADTDTLLASLDSAAVELAIVTLPLRGEGHEVVPFYEDTMVLVASPRHPLAAVRPRMRNALETVSETGLITYPSQSTTRRTIERVFIENGYSLRAEMEMSSPEAIKRLTEAGLGASILPAKLVASELRRGTLKVIPTGNVRFSRLLGVVFKNRENLSQPATAFLKMLLDKYDMSTS